MKSLFPSLTAKNSGIAIREQFSKSDITWTNVNWRQVSLYIRLQDKYWTNGELDEIEMYLPVRLSALGRPPSIGTLGVESRFKWP